MKNPIIWTVLLATGLLFTVGLLGSGASAPHILHNRQGYAPAQPIAFSHRLHAGELQVACGYCHTAAAYSRHAGIPSASVCMNCHRFVEAPLGALRAEEVAARDEGRSPNRIVSADIQKIYDALALGEDRTPVPGGEAIALNWVKVHRVPDYVYFDHRAHVSVGVECQRCHGAIESMERVRQVETLSMGWCVACHRQANETGIAGRPVEASLDCVVCHY